MQFPSSTSYALNYLIVFSVVCSGCIEARRTTLEPMSELVSTEIDSGLNDLPSAPSVPPGSTALRRLTRTQYEQSLKSVFGETVVVPKVSEPDIPEAGLFSVGASSTSYSPRGIASLEEAAYAVAQQVVSTDELKSRAIPCDLETESTETRVSCINDIMALNGLRLWRRPLKEDELGRLVSLANQATEVLNDPWQGVSFGLAAMMQSPNFLYRLELAPSQVSADGERFDPYALATRLSFFLWNHSPDDELLEAADSGILDTQEGLKAQAERLMASPQFKFGLEQFFIEKLKLYELDTLRKDPLQFDHYSPELMREAREETLRLIDYYVLERDSDLRELMTSREHFLTPRLAALYGVPAPVQDGFRRVTLPEESPRLGLLSHASLLSINAHPAASSATLRGRFVRTVLLCQEIPPPPPGVDTAIPEASGNTRTLRDRVAEHLTNPSCAGCHKLLDPIGLALENYDAIGRWRERDNGALIDASGELDGVSYEDPQSLSQVVREHPEFTSCLVKSVAQYATGRLITDEEAPLLQDLNTRFERLEFRLKPLFLELVLSPLFYNAGAPK